MKILVAEDDFSSKLLLAEVLKRKGHEVITAGDGNEAWNIMKERDAPHLAILDWMMPEMEGPEVVRKIRELPTEMPPYIIMLTSKSAKSEIIAGLEAGADDYLTKPFNHGELIARVNVGRRIIEIQDSLIKSRELLAHQATHDTLTGLLNRRAILEQLNKELARTYSHGELLVVGMCDIDHFKVINDTYGHQSGDDVLCAFSRILVENVREYDSVGRLGGEEFLIIMPMKSMTNYISAFDQLCSRIAEAKIPTRSGILSVTMSTGLVCANSDSTTDQILEMSDKAMYQAKKEGRNRVVHA